MSRDADRSRRAILDAAEALFAERGFEGASLGDIAARCQLSRATPSYFFGSKQDLYVAVLERVFAERQAATELAFRPVGAWCGSDGDLDALRRALTRALGGYMDFLLARPAFVRLLTHEELAGGGRLRHAHRSSTAIRDALAALRAVAPRRGIRRFEVTDALLAVIALTFAPLAHQATLMVAIERDLSDDEVRRRHIRFATEVLMGVVTG